MADRECDRPGCPNPAESTTHEYCDDHALDAVVHRLDNLSGYVDENTRYTASLAEELRKVRSSVNDIYREMPSE